MIFERERPTLKWSKLTQGTRELYFLKITVVALRRMDCGERDKNRSEEMLTQEDAVAAMLAGTGGGGDKQK